MDRNDYTSIRNMRQLHEARSRLKEAVGMKEIELKNDIRACKEALNPVTYINRAITKLYTMEYLTKYFIKGYEFVKDLVGRWKGNNGTLHETPTDTEIKATTETRTGTGTEQ